MAEVKHVRSPDPPYMYKTAIQTVRVCKHSNGDDTDDVVVVALLLDYREITAFQITVPRSDKKGGVITQKRRKEIHGWRLPLKA